MSRADDYTVKTLPVLQVYIFVIVITHDYQGEAQARVSVVFLDEASV